MQRSDDWATAAGLGFGSSNQRLEFSFFWTASAINCVNGSQMKGGFLTCDGCLAARAPSPRRLHWSRAVRARRAHSICLLRSLDPPLFWLVVLDRVCRRLRLVDGCLAAWTSRPIRLHRSLALAASQAESSLLRNRPCDLFLKARLRKRRHPRLNPRRSFADDHICICGGDC